MLSRVLNMFRVADLRNKIIFTLAMIGLYRLGSFVPAPGVDIEAVQDLRDQANSGGILGYIQLFSGGALTQFAIFALGIMPYITSSIIDRQARCSGPRPAYRSGRIGRPIVIEHDLRSLGTLASQGWISSVPTMPTG